MDDTDLIQKITAPNAGMFTGKGTNSYLIGKKDITLVDPGPNIQSHLENIIEASSGNLKRIFVTHTHTDHSPGADPLAKRLGIPCYGNLVEHDFAMQDRTFKPDKLFTDGYVLETEEYTLEAIYTPGHASNHFCFLVREQQCLLSGDHIMDGSTVVIAPNDGSMKDYLDSLEKLFTYDIQSIAPGHGNLINNPQEVIQWTIDHRLQREKKVIDALKKLGKCGLTRLLISVYSDVNPKLLPIAKWSLESHLVKLIDDGVVIRKQNRYSLTEIN